MILKNHQPIDSSDDNDDKVNKADAAAKTKFSNYSFNSDDIGDIVEKFKTDLTNGLSASQYQENLKTYGINKQSKPSIRIIEKNIHVFLWWIWFVIISWWCIMYHLLETFRFTSSSCQFGSWGDFIGGVLIQAGFNFIQDYSSSKVMESIHSLVASEIMCIRDGQKLKSVLKILFLVILLFLPLGLKFC